MNTAIKSYKGCVNLISSTMQSIKINLYGMTNFLHGFMGAQCSCNEVT